MIKGEGIAYKLQFLMLQHSISVADLSLRTQIERSTLTKILNCSTVNPRIDTISSLAKYFKVDISKLINEDNSLNELTFTSKHKELKDILLHLMTINGINSLTLLSKYTNVAIAILSDIVNGKTKKPHIPTLQQIANFFNISILQLTGMEKIPDYKTTTIIPSTQILPVISLQQTKNWIDGTLKNISEYASTSRNINGKKSFAINITCNTFSPDFFNNYTLIIDNEETLKINDFCICEIKNKVSIFECIDHSDHDLTFREAGQINLLNTKKSDIAILGIVVQHIINPRKFT